MFNITQTTADLEECAELEATVLANLAKRPRENYTGLEAERRYFIGYRCEFAVRDWLASMAGWLPSEYQINTNGESQPSEFRVRFGGQWNRLEVKGRGKATNTDAWFKKAQKHDWRMAVFPHLIGGVDDPRVAIRGWLSIHDLPNIPAHKQNPDPEGSYMLPWAKLRSLHRLAHVFLELQTNEEWLASFA